MTEEEILECAKERVIAHDSSSMKEALFQLSKEYLELSIENSRNSHLCFNLHMEYNNATTRD